MFTSSLITIASYLAFALLLLRVILDRKSVIFSLRRFYSYLHQTTNCFQICRIPEYDEVTTFPNQLYRKALAYVASLPSTEDTSAVNIVSTRNKSNDYSVQPAPTEFIVDQFNGAQVYWTHVSGCLHLRIRHVDRLRVLRPYLQHIESVYVRSEDAKLFVRNGDSWKGVPFTHPATFENLWVDVDLINKVKSDLDQFSKGRNYYNGVGRPWKRSYLLHGPPGTGKTTFAAAMANHLCYDVYEFDLSASSLDLKPMLLKTGPKSLILVEGIRRGLNDGNLVQAMDFMDGVCNSGEGRIMVLTMSDQRKEEVDSDLLKMDVHVKFTHCDFKGFKRLAMRLLGVKEHKLYGEVEERFGRAGGAALSYKEVGEIMIANRGSPSRAIKSVINMLNRLSVSDGEVGHGGGKEEGEEGCGAGGGLGFGKEATVREIKKLYGLIRRSGSRREGTMSVEMAAAAAAAAAAASVKGSGSDRSSGSLR